MKLARLHLPLADTYIVHLSIFLKVSLPAEAAAALAKAAERQREVELFKAAMRWSNKFVLGRTFSAWLAALATARSSARDEARARGLLVPLEHAGLSDRLAAAVAFARAEGVAAAAEISAHGLVSAFVAALAPIGRVHESKVRDELRRPACTKIGYGDFCFGPHMRFFALHTMHIAH